MSDAEPPHVTRATGGTELALRAASAFVLAPLAIGAAYVGGWTFALFWSAAAMVVLWEWTRLVSGGDQRSVLILGCMALFLAVMLAEISAGADPEFRSVRLWAALIILAMGMLACAIIAPKGRVAWLTVGIPYAGALALAPVALRADAVYGFAALVMLFAIVWTTDIAAYFVGRAVGGPKLVRRWSPNKTWSGAIGGLLGAVIVAVVIARMFGIGNLPAIAVVTIALSVASQAGDIFESAVKRQFGAKDSSSLIPGHGGLMDRVDGFVAAATLACAMGLWRGGIEAPAQGLLVW